MGMKNEEGKTTQNIQDNITISVFDLTLKNFRHHFRCLDFILPSFVLFESLFMCFFGFVLENYMHDFYHAISVFL